MGLFKSLGLLAGIAGAGIVIFAQKRSAETGRDIKDVMADLPSELKDAGASMKHKFEGAAGVYKQASAEKEREIDRLLEEEEARMAAASEAIRDPAIPV